MTGGSTDARSGSDVVVGEGEVCVGCGASDAMDVFPDAKQLHS